MSPAGIMLAVIALGAGVYGVNRLAHTVNNHVLKPAAHVLIHPVKTAKAVMHHETRK